jgi:predicted nucleotidyltransferase
VYGSRKYNIGDLKQTQGSAKTVHVDSDIDLLVEFETPSFDNFMDLTFSLEEIFQRKVDLITSRSLSPYIKPYVDKEIHWYEG